MLVPNGCLLLQMEPPAEAGQGRQAAPVRAPGRAVCAGAPHALLHLPHADGSMVLTKLGSGVLLSEMQGAHSFVQPRGRIRAAGAVAHCVCKALGSTYSDCACSSLVQWTGRLQTCWWHSCWRARCKNARRRAAVRAALGLEPDAEGAAAIEGIADQAVEIKLPRVTRYRTLPTHDLSQQGCGVSGLGGYKFESLEPGIHRGPCSQAMGLPLERLSPLMRALASCLGPTAVYTVAGTRGLRRTRAQSWRGMHAGILPHSRVIPDTACVCTPVLGRAYG